MRATVKFGPALGGEAIEAARATFAREGFVRLEGVLSEEDAQELYAFLSESADWWRVVNQGEKVWDLGPEAIERLEGGDGGKLLELVHRGARDGFQFIYDAVRLSDDSAERAARGLPVDGLLDALNSPEWLALLRRVTGFEEIAFADGQATRYLAGHFLTGHDDEVEGKNRLAAYVLGFTPLWRTEWGGLLQFHTEDGDVARALMPRFNAMSLFRVPQLHSVSPVAPYAGAPRYSVTGWLRAG